MPDTALDILQPVELVVFFTVLFGVMIVGLIAGRKEETSEDYFLAGRGIPWWGVAGSIFGSNVSVNHLVGMLGIGFSIGYFQAHFEYGAVFGLMVLCYLFLPVYRKLGVFTLSEYLGRRYDDRSRVAYAIIMVVIMAYVQMVPGLYIGSRTICELIGGEAAQVQAGNPLDVPIGTAEEEAAGKTFDPPPKRVVNTTYYAIFVCALAFVSATYTIFGGLKAVVWTDVFQSILLLFAGIFICVRTFSLLGGWSVMMSLDGAEILADQKMHLYLPASDADLPWTGVFTGLMAMHCFYWGTNQFIVQRALGARSDNEAKVGIIAAGFLKLLIPIVSISTGVAAFYLFNRDNVQGVQPDAAFARLVGYVVPIGYGLVGLVGAGVIGALLSSIDSMMNSAATIFTIDIYKKYVRPEAPDRELIRFGRVTIVGLCILAALLAIFGLNPNSDRNFFLVIANYQNYLTPGLLVAFFMGMFWKRGTGAGAIAAIVAGVALSWVAEVAYHRAADMNRAVYDVLMDSDEGKVVESPKLATTKRVKLPDVTVTNVAGDDVKLREADRATIAAYVETQRARLNWLNRRFGPQLNFFHRVVFVIGLSAVAYVLISLGTSTNPEQSSMTWAALGGHSGSDVLWLFGKAAVSIAVFAGLGWLHITVDAVTPRTSGILAALWTFAMFVPGMIGRFRSSEGVWAVVANDLFWAGLLCSTAVYLHYAFY